MSKNAGTLVGAPIRVNDSNDTYPSAYSSEIKGGRKVVANLTALYALANKSDQLEQGVTVVNVTNNGIGQADYVLIDLANAGNSSGWQLYFVGLQNTSNLNQPGGYVGLDSSGKISLSHLPSYVDSVVEVSTYSALPSPGATSTIYYTLDTNLEYRWGGTHYVELVPSPGTTDAVPEGTTNEYFTTSRVLNTLLTGLSFVSGIAISSSDTILAALGKLQEQLSNLFIVPNGGTTNQVLGKISDTNGDIGWIDMSGGSGSPSTLEQSRVYLNPIQAIQVSGYYIVIDPFTKEYCSYKQITVSWSDAKCDGFIYIKAGGVYYERVISTPYLNAKWFGAIGDGNSHPLSTITNPSTGGIFASLSEAQTYYPTAFSLTNEVDGLAIQNALNFAIYSQKRGCPKNVWLPFGKYVTSDTIHLGYGDTYTSTVLYGGDSFPYDINNTYMKGAAIVPNFSDRPCINVQGARESVIKGINTSGLNIKNPGYNTLIWADPSQYVSSGLGVNADSVTAPYAGICIDGWAGARPTLSSGVDYPDINYPISGNALGISITTQYNKNPSSRVTIESCRITNYVVGVVVQPSGSEANGDFIKLYRNMIGICKYGLSSGGGQARLIETNDCQMDQCFFLYTNAIHGKQRGRINSIINCHLSGYQALYFVETGWNGPLKLDSCYAETLFRVGVFGTARASASALSIYNCDFDMYHISGVPAYWIGTAADVLLSIRNSRYSGAWCPILANNCVLEGVTAELDVSLTTPLVGNSNAIFANTFQFTGGLPLIPQVLGIIPNKVMKSCNLSVPGLASSLTVSGVGNDVGYENKSDYRFNYDVTKGFSETAGFARNELRIYDKAFTDPPYPPLTSGSRLLLIPIGQIFALRLTKVGDYLFDAANQAMWIITAIDSTNVTMLLMNGFTNNSSGTVTSYENPNITTSSFNSHSYHFVAHTTFNRTYAIGNAGTYNIASLVGSVISGSNLITGIQSADGQVQGSGQWGTINSSVPLYFYGVDSTSHDPNNQLTSYQGPYNITNLDLTGYTITIDQNSTYTGKVYIFNTSLYK